MTVLVLMEGVSKIASGTNVAYDLQLSWSRFVASERLSLWCVQKKLRYNVHSFAAIAYRL